MATEMKKLLKEREFTYIIEYFDMILTSWINGQKKQADAQFLEMEIDDRKSFILHLVSTEEPDLCQHFMWLL